MDKSKWLSIGVLVLFYAIVTCLADLFYWSADACFFANIFAVDDSIPPRAVNSVYDIMISQAAHYMTWSGRFFCQSLVQVFCGLLPREIFVFANGAVWLLFILLVAKIIGIRLSDIGRLSFLCLISFFIFAVVPFDPPFMINYLWMATVNLLWLYLFLNMTYRSTLQLIGMVIIGLLAGNSQEAFSIPMSGALCVLILQNRFRMSGGRWALAIAYIVGTLTVVVAPGNFVRLVGDNSASTTIVDNLRSGLPSLLVFVSLIVLAIILRGRNADNRDLHFLLRWSFVWSILLILIFRFQYVSRLLIPANLCLSLFVLSSIDWRRSGKSLLAVGGICFVIVAGMEATRFAFNCEKYTLIERLYHESPDGLVFIPDKMYIHDDGYNFYYDSGWMLRERTVDSQKPDLHIMPESYRRVRGKCDSLTVKQIADQAWLFVIPRDSVDGISFNRVLLPGILNLSLSPRKINGDGPADVLMDSTATTVAGVYFNNRPYMRVSF